MTYKLKKIDIFNILLFFFAFLSYLLSFGDFKLFLWISTGFTALRLLIILKRKILWKTRNRLIFSGLFFVITPLFFIISLFVLVSSIVMGQYGVTIVNNMMNLQLKSLNDYAENSIEQYEISDNQEEFLKKRIKWIEKKAKSGVEKKSKKSERLILCYMMKDETGDFYSLGNTDENFDIEKFKTYKGLNGYFLLGKKLYYGVIREGKKLKILAAININQNVFTNYISKISDYSVRFRKPGKRENIVIGNIKNKEIHDDKDIGVSLSSYTYKYLNFNNSTTPIESIASFPIKLNIGNMYNKWKNETPFKDDDSIITIIYILIAIFGFLIILSFLVGFKIIRVITKAINQLTKGTHKIRNGDFSFRIKIKSKDQLQYLAESFNEMASGINRLLVEEKEKHRLEEELRIARTIQEKLLPNENFETNEFEISAINIPAEEIAGDYFDYYYKKDDYLMLIIADVSGKGASAAFYMAELKGVNNHLRKTDISPAKLTAEFHHSLVDTFDKVTFITMSIAKFNIPEKKFVFSRAGHTKGILYNKNEDKIIELFPNGIAIGVPHFSEYKIQEISIGYNSGDILILFSDGLSEIMNEDSDMFEIDRIKSVLEENKDKSASDIKEIMLKESEVFAQDIPNQDDLTLMVLKVK